ncbi:MAG: von Willebrand factor type A domain-containing protein, partial [Lachnospiraceae bacterium]|nr:von Willebrand factor type A domain-containing protein [Lachnospiraceae bacterium]
MKKKIITAILAGTIVTTSMTGCGAVKSASDATAAESPAVCIEAEYPDEAPAADNYEEAAGSYYIEAETGEYKNESFAAAENSYSADSYARSQAVDMEASTLCPDLIYPEPAPKHRPNGETYNSVVENPFTDVASSPLSTFGADVDTASYSNLRRMINDGYSLFDIPKGSIRTEELVNYFDYAYKSPKSGDDFAVNASIIDCPWNSETKLVNLGIKAREMEEAEDMASNIVFLIDVSGS